jgi:hypothetical protein
MDLFWIDQISKIEFIIGYLFRNISNPDSKSREYIAKAFGLLSFRLPK